MVKRSLRLLGHDLQIASRPGQGTRFRLVLRAAPSPGQLERRLSVEVAEEDERPLPRRILVMDCEGNIRVALSALLGVNDSSVVCVKNAGQAEQPIYSSTCADEPFHVLVCDNSLSQGEDTLRLAHRFVERLELAMRVLLLMGETAAECFRNVQASGMQVLFKPVSAGELLSALRGQGVHAPVDA